MARETAKSRAQRANLHERAQYHRNMQLDARRAELQAQRERLRDTIQSAEQQAIIQQMRELAQ